MMNVILPCVGRRKRVNWAQYQLRFWSFHSMIAGFAECEGAVFVAEALLVFLACFVVPAAVLGKSNTP